MEGRYIDYDMEKIHELKKLYLENMKFIKGHLPKVDWDSRIQTKIFFDKWLGINLKNNTISHILSHREKFDAESPEYDIITGVTMYFKLKYAIKNYLDCIIRHNQNGRVMLRHCDGQWKMPNKQPLSGSPEIIGCQALERE